MENSKHLHWLDYSIFGFSLLLSVSTGVYHALKDRFFPSPYSNEKDEYLVGGRRMPPLPIALSLLTSFLSGVLMLGVPAEIYVRGAQVWVYFVMGVVASFLTAQFFLPVFHRMKSTCVHEYFIFRYDSLLIRRLYSLLFLSYTLIYMAIVIYAPAVAISRVIDIDKMVLMAVFGMATTLYTCIGGLKAVVWADSLQAVLMYSGVLCLLIRGLMNERVGGIGRVARIAMESKRLEDIWNIDPHLTQYTSIWISFTSGTVTWLASFGVNQLAIQRYVSLPSLKDAQSIIYWTLFPFLLLISLVCSIGLLALAYYYNCDASETGEAKDEDHLIILFARDILQPIPGLFGLYISCILAATLSTLSSGINSVAAAVYEDWLKDSLDGRISDRSATMVNKGLTVVSGIIATGIAFMGETLGGVMKMCVNLLGALAGPMVAIFFLAIFVPRSGKWSTIVSFVASLVIISAIFLVSYFDYAYGLMYLPTNTTEEGCIGLTTNNITLRPPVPYNAHFGNPDASWVARISPWSYPGIGFIVMILIAIPLTFFESEDKTKRYLTFYGRHDDWPSEKKSDKILHGLTLDSSKSSESPLLAPSESA